MIDKRSNIQWSVWANQTIYFGGITLLLGGIIGIVGSVYNVSFVFWLPIGIYGIIFGLCITVLEYPRGKKVKGHSVPRFKQEFISGVVDKLSYAKNFNFRSLFYFVVSIPACLIAPTFLGAVCIIFGCAIYVLAACCGEVWSPITEYSKPSVQIQYLHVPPSRPPPRIPVNRIKS